MARPLVTVSINAVTPHLAIDHADVPSLAADLERWGVDQVVLADHLLVPADVTHPGGADVDLLIPFPEPFVMLAAIASKTERVLLTTGALVAPSRSALVVAKLAATLDVVSGGRFRLGITSGWFAPDFDAVGVPFDERFKRLDEMIDVCRTLWGQQPASFDGRWTKFEQMYCLPTPLSGHDLPIWFGGRTSEATARRVARCDGWIVSEAESMEGIRHGLSLMRAAFHQVGRDPDSVAARATLTRSLPGAGRTPSRAICDAAWAELVERVNAGITDVCVPIQCYAMDRDAAREIVTDLVARVDEAFGPSDLSRAVVGRSTG